MPQIQTRREAALEKAQSDAAAEKARLDALAAQFEEEETGELSVSLVCKRMSCYRALIFKRDSCATMNLFLPPYFQLPS